MRTPVAHWKILGWSPCSSFDKPKPLWHQLDEEVYLIFIRNIATTLQQNNFPLTEAAREALSPYQHGHKTADLQQGK